MKIYVGHSTSYDFKKELYEPLRNSDLNSTNEITLPHESSEKQFNSKEYLKNCDLMIAEVSYPSTGLGIEMGWANSYGVSIICIHKKEAKPSGAVYAVTNKVFNYTTPEDLVNVLKSVISSK